MCEENFSAGIWRLYSDFRDLKAGNTDTAQASEADGRGSLRETDKREQPERGKLGCTSVPLSLHSHTRTQGAAWRGHEPRSELKGQW